MDQPAYGRGKSPICISLRAPFGSSLSPFVSCPLLLTVTLAPAAARDALSSLLSTPIGDGVIASAKVVLRALLGVGIIRWVNWGVNTLAARSWRLTTDRRWDWSEEIAVVTGGSSGIGQETVAQLADLGARP